MPRIEDAEGVDPTAPAPTHRESRGSLPIPGDISGNTVEVPATRSSISDAAQFMHNLSFAPSSRDRRASRNSFGTSLPIPRSPRVSRLSSVVTRDVSRDILASQVQDMSKEKVAAAKNMAFAFDIDGVLAHGNHAIPQAKEALKMLNGDNELGIKIPYILLTNGGGKTEEARCAQLTEVLDCPISTDQFIQSHTPMQALAEYYETVLVLGGEGQKIREVAENYGFKNVIHPKDIQAWDPTVSPWSTLTEEEKAEAKPRDFSQVKFDAILVFADSRDYQTDMQLIMDLLLADDGKLLTRAKDPVASRIPIYFSQGDLLMPTDHKGPPRLTQGLFRISIEAQYKALTGVDLERVVYGKPERATYTYADEVLKSWMEEIHNENKLPENIYMVGDNPASDICGGNMHGWNTCLVRTGVFQGGDNDDNNPANFGVFPNVLEAVKAAVRKELGQEFKFKWNPKVNPVLHSENASAVE
ncbi:phosphatidyl synthase [Aspergillus japonicus CBS 114.51]|uniref:Phosphatidyl synthase n=3 Tax=Aspergillus TaxID=5052 RepID=A0A2V5H3P1_ASPV1|nr:phosphatidyl synthase [Aspergillus japonicus CBS 114.51]PYI18608.1 phosphatidyl synthase [Aspergillus violaceofuscus CBS 115571]PYI35488.1 phosphatidyl synthase [Aspergillus indologenus CBS 114.80]RAH86912.1 phosphatidyl synthase [Aspergillus japonicus CBS 114.51]